MASKRATKQELLVLRDTSYIVLEVRGKYLMKSVVEDGLCDLWEKGIR